MKIVSDHWYIWTVHKSSIYCYHPPPLLVGTGVFFKLMPGHPDLPWVKLSVSWAQTCLLLSWFAGSLCRPCTYTVGSLVSSHAYMPTALPEGMGPWAQLGLASLPHLVWDCRWTLSLSPPSLIIREGTALPVPYLLSTPSSSSLMDQLASCCSPAQTCTVGAI